MSSADSLDLGAIRHRAQVAEKKAMSPTFRDLGSDALALIDALESARSIAARLEQQNDEALRIAGGWDVLARGVKDPKEPYNESWVDAMYRCADYLQHLLGPDFEGAPVDGGDDDE